jgi:hypothetical protein
MLENIKENFTAVLSKIEKSFENEVENFKNYPIRTTLKWAVIIYLLQLFIGKKEK